MLRVNTLLFPTDGSPCAEYAYRHAAYLAHRLGATLHVLHVVEEPPKGFSDLSDVVEVREEDILEQLRLPIADASETVSEERVRRERRTHASAAEGILAYAEEHGVDLIVMGTHGRRGMRRLFMGSVAEEVVHRSDCPVLTICGEKQQAPRHEIRRILVPMELFDHPDRLLAHAKEVATIYEARLDLLHVVEDVSLPTAYSAEPLPIDDEKVEQHVRRALGSYASTVRADGIEAEVHVAAGYPARAILDFIEHQPIDLVVLATHGRSGLQDLLLGSTAERVVRRARCPVFTVKSFGKSLVPETADRIARTQSG